MRENHFGPDVAARYDDDCAAMFAPEVLAPALDRLEELAAGGPRARARHRHRTCRLCRSRRAACP